MTKGFHNKKLKWIVYSEEVRKAAEFLHDMFCHKNHTDGCSWFYGGWDKDIHIDVRKKWCRKAIYALKTIPLKQIRACHRIYMSLQIKVHR